MHCTSNLEMLQDNHVSMFMRKIKCHVLLISAKYFQGQFQQTNEDYFCLQLAKIYKKFQNNNVHNFRIPRT